MNRYIVTPVPFIALVSSTFWLIFWPVFAAILAAIAVIVLVASQRITLWRIIDFIVAAIFIYAGVLKVLDPIQLAHDINNYRILPWTMSVALAFYLPWLEILCGLGLAFRFLYRGALSILTVLIVVFTLATIAAKARGLDITCGCFGHASKNLSFVSHLAIDLGLLAGVVCLWLIKTPARKPT